MSVQSSEKIKDTQSPGQTKEAKYEAGYGFLARSE